MEICDRALCTRTLSNPALSDAALPDADSTSEMRFVRISRAFDGSRNKYTHQRSPADLER
jgi:hypothetical protein